MPTVRAALEALEADLFVGRQAELDEFVNWVIAEPVRPEILQVTGHAGAGKSSLLRAFGRRATELGRHPVIYVDGEAIAPQPDAFTQALTGKPGGDASDFLGDQPALLMIDGMDELVPLTRWLTTELLPSFDERVRVVVAGRQPLGPMWKPWLSSMRQIRLDSLSKEASSAYLERRGVAGDVADKILEAAGGYPLGLSLAADLALQHDVTRFAKAPEWRLTLRGLVDELVQDAPRLRPLMEAAAVVRQFDEPTLTAVIGSAEPHEAFSELCAVSFVRPAQHGLALHRDVRRVVLEELQWRNPERLAELLSRARAYYRDRIRQRRRGEEWLVPERMYLWNSSYFPSGDASSIWVEAGGPGDIDELLAIQSEWLAALAGGAPLPALPPDEECSPDFLGAIVDLPGAEILIARSPDGRAHGYSFLMPVSEASLALLPPDGAIRQAIERGIDAATRACLPPTSEGSRVTYMSADAVRGERAGEAFAALAAETFRFGIRGGVFVACTGNPIAAQAAGAIGMARIPGVATSSLLGAARPIDGFVIDIGRIGPDTWLEAVTTGRPIPPAMSDDEWDKELHEILLNWPDDARLAQSALVQLAAITHPDGGANPASAMRDMVRRAVTDARVAHGEEFELACRAIELAYFDRKLGHEAIAERLNVSRTTFYRLIHRAEREVATQLALAIRT